LNFQLEQDYSRVDGTVFRAVESNIKNHSRGLRMNAEKILGLLALALSVVGGFVVIPYAVLALVVIGLLLGSIVDREGSLRIMATAIVLTGAASHTLDAIPAVGAQLSGIVGGLAAMSAGTSITLAARNMWMRFKP
jgi:hypothetical protein